MARPKVGDHVQLKGLFLRGYSGTVITKPSFLSGNFRVRLDEGQYRVGNKILTVNSRNVVKQQLHLV
jgi:hypothetical protein